MNQREKDKLDLKLTIDLMDYMGMQVWGGEEVTWERRSDMGERGLKSDLRPLTPKGETGERGDMHCT